MRTFHTQVRVARWVVILAALALLAITVWLASQQKSYLFTLIPMVFMFTVTTAALVTLFYLNIFIQQNYILAFLAIILMALSIILSIQAFQHLKNGVAPAQLMVKEGTD